MDEGLQGEGEEAKAPMITIQPDWEDALFTSVGEVWISCKFTGKDTIYTKLRYHAGSFTSDEFTVTSFRRNYITVKHNKTGFERTFLAPAQTLSHIHNKSVVALDVSHADFGVSVCSDSILRVWDRKYGKILNTITGRVVEIYKCKFFPSGVAFLTGGGDMQLKIWCAKIGVCPVTLIGHKSAVNDFCIVDKGRNIISVSKDGTARLWSCGESECLGIIFNSKDRLNCCAICDKNNITAEGREEAPSSREIGTHNKLLLIGSEEGYIYGVAVYARKKIFTLNVNSAINTIVANDDYFAAGCQNGKIEVYKTGDDVQKLKTYFESKNPILCSCLCRSNSFLIGRMDGTVLCFDFNCCTKPIITLTGPDCDPVYSICSEKNEIFTACRDSNIRRYLIHNIVK